MQYVAYNILYFRDFVLPTMWRSRSTIPLNLVENSTHLIAWPNLGMLTEGFLSSSPPKYRRLRHMANYLRGYPIQGRSPDRKDD